MRFRPWKRFQPHPVIGVDEAGRGCLAGPVYAAAVILNPEKSHSDFVDSKQLSESGREEAFSDIMAHHRVGIGISSVDEIFEMNILWASMLAMKRAVLALKAGGGHVLVDGNRLIPDLVGYEQTAMVKGDSLYRPIAAASICAKVSRDRELKKLAREYPEYELDQHKGYSTPRHKELIAQFGPCEIHRQSFAGVREHLSKVRKKKSEQLSWSLR